MSKNKLLSIAKTLADAADSLGFEPPVSHCYNPLQYAWEPCAQYLQQYGTGKKEVVLLGMNPGPFGMAQTGVPFGDCTIVKDWLQITGRVEKPNREHPKRLIYGLDCPRGEVSGTRLWGWAQARYKTPERFFAKYFVWNYCPLCFMGESGKNLTPDKLPKAERDALFAVCDKAFAELCGVLRPSLVIGVGKFAEKRAAEALKDQQRKIGTILHPSPASPAANRGWQERAEAQLRELGVDL